MTEMTEAELERRAEQIASWEPDWFVPVRAMEYRQLLALARRALPLPPPPTREADRMPALGTTSVNDLQHLIDRDDPTREEREDGNSGGDGSVVPNSGGTLGCVSADLDLAEQTLAPSLPSEAGKLRDKTDEWDWRKAKERQMKDTHDHFTSRIVPQRIDPKIWGPNPTECVFEARERDGLTASYCRLHGWDCPHNPATYHQIDIPNDVRELRRYREENAQLRAALIGVAELILKSLRADAAKT